MPEWLGEAFGVALFLAILWGIIRFNEWWREREARKARRAEQRAARRPGPIAEWLDEPQHMGDELKREAKRHAKRGTIVVEGVVVTRPDLAIVTGRQFGCLGGPIVHRVPPFELELDGGGREWVTLGEDPGVENLDRLFGRMVPASQDVPIPTDAPDSIAKLRGRVRVAGVRRTDEGLAPPKDYSAVLTVLE